MLAGMTTCSRLSVQVRLSGRKATFSITGKCCGCPCRTYEGRSYPVFLPMASFFFRGKNRAFQSLRIASGARTPRKREPCRDPAWRGQAPDAAGPAQLVQSPYFFRSSFSAAPSQRSSAASAFALAASSTYMATAASAAARMPMSSVKPSTGMMSGTTSAGRIR